jgi:hypothetical protein
MNAMYNPLQKINPFDKTGKSSVAPAAFALFPKDISTPPKELVARFFNIQRWSEKPRGGHFAAMETPELLVEDIREFVVEQSSLFSVTLNGLQYTEHDSDSL